MKRIVLVACIGILCLFSVCFAENAPVSLLAFYATEGKTADLAKAVELRVAVNHCLYGEPMQTITDAQIVKRVADAVSAMTVNGQHDRISSTGTYCAYAFYDETGAYLFGASFQDGLLMETDGRYDVSGLDTLFSIEGVMLPEDWERYWGDVDELEDMYLRDLRVSFPASIFELRGYAASLLDVEDVTGVEIYVSWNDEAGRLNTSDPELISRVFTALEGIEATGNAPEDGDGLTYFITFRYADKEANIDRTVWFRFEGDRLECDENTYAVSGLEGLFGVEGVDVLAYLREHYMD